MSEQEALNFFAVEIDLSEHGILKNAYVIAPHAERSDLISALTFAIQEVTGLSAATVQADDPAYDPSTSDPRTLLIAHKKEIMGTPAEIVMLFLPHFEKFFGRQNLCRYQTAHMGSARGRPIL